MAQIQATDLNVQHGTRLIHKKTGKEVAAYYPSGSTLLVQSVKNDIVTSRRIVARIENYWLK